MISFQTFQQKAQKYRPTKSYTLEWGFHNHIMLLYLALLQVMLHLENNGFKVINCKLSVQIIGLNNTAQLMLWLSSISMENVKVPRIIKCNAAKFISIT